jgi:glutathione S-transferase
VCFTSGPVEAAFTAKSMGWEVPIERQAMAGFGSYDAAMNTLEKALDGRQFIAGNRFTAADLFVGAMVNFMLTFKLLDPRPAFTDYAKRMTDRDAYRRASEIDGKLIADMQAKQPAEEAEAHPS